MTGERRAVFRGRPPHLDHGYLAVCTAARLPAIGEVNPTKINLSLFGPLQPETASQNQRSKRDVISDRALNRKAHPRIATQNGSHFPQPLQQCLSPGRFLKARNRKVVAHQQRTLDQHAVGR